MRTLVSAALGGLLAFTLSCSDDSEGKLDTGGGGSDAAISGDSAVVGQEGGTPDSSSGTCSGCNAGEGCLLVEVTRTADDSNMPWIVWPSEADGKGTLIVTAVEQASGGGAREERYTVADADFTSSSASYPVDLGCLPAADFKVHTFLDDNNNAQPNAVYSADYRDTCPGAPRAKDVTVTAGQQAKLVVQLANSCD
jgi:hypothetical protein